MATRNPAPEELDAFLALASTGDVANFLGTSEGALFFNLYSKAAPKYYEFDIPKAGGGARRIAAPPSLIASWQRALLPVLSSLYVTKLDNYGFVPKRNVVDNGARHLGRRLILRIDLENFFPTIHFGRVRGVFLRPPFGFNATVASVLAQICCNNGSLPQGAPTSPVLSNFVCRRLDLALGRFVRKRNCAYTRYADDINISTKNAVFSEDVLQKEDPLDSSPRVGLALRELIEGQHFEIHEKKTRVRGYHQRQLVTGIVVNKKTNVPREYVRRLRATLRNWRVHGEALATEKFQLIDASTRSRFGSPPSLRAHVAGKLNFMRLVRGRGDSLYTKHALEYQELTKSKPVAICGGAAFSSGFLSHAVWVVVGRDSVGDVSAQGTAFFLRDVGFVTALHVFDDVAVPIETWQLQRSLPPFTSYAIRGYRANPHIDLAVLLTDARPSASLVRAAATAEQGELTVVGYPNWHSLADGLLKTPTHIVQAKTVSGVRYIGVSYALLSGNSGGPMLDGNGEVAAIVTNSKDNATIANAGVAISHIEAAAAASVVNLV